MTISVLSTQPRFQALSSTGAPVPGFFLYTAQPGTVAGPNQTFPKNTYTDSTTSVANSNPVIGDSVGRANVWLDGTYSLALYDANGVMIWSEDNVGGVAPGSIEVIPSSQIIGVNQIGTTIKVFGDATLGTYAANILAANDPAAPDRYLIFKIDPSANHVVITPASGTIKGRASVILAVQGNGIQIEKNPTNNNWYDPTSLPAIFNEDASVTSSVDVAGLTDVIVSKSDSTADVLDIVDSTGNTFEGLAKYRDGLTAPGETVHLILLANNWVVA